MAIRSQKDSNLAPIVNAGKDRWFPVGGYAGQPNAALLGQGTFDPDRYDCAANTANYTAAWSFVSVPAGSARTNADIVNATSLQNASFVPDIAGDYVLQLNFTDDPGTCQGSAKTGTDTVTIKAGYRHGQAAVYDNVIGAPPVAGAEFISARTERLEYGVMRVYSHFLLGARKACESPNMLKADARQHCRDNHGIGKYNFEPLGHEHSWCWSLTGTGTRYTGFWRWWTYTP